MDNNNNQQPLAIPPVPNTAIHGVLSEAERVALRVTVAQTHADLKRPPSPKWTNEDIEDDMLRVELEMHWQ